MEPLNTVFCIISDKSSSLERRFRDSQIVISTNFVVVSSVASRKNAYIKLTPLTSTFIK